MSFDDRLSQARDLVRQLADGPAAAELVEFLEHAERRVRDLEERLESKNSLNFQMLEWLLADARR